MSGLKGLVTGIGSLPHKDAEAALDLIFQYAPQIPFWPQLPKRDIREGMVAQYSENLPCLRVAPDSLVFDSKEKEKELEKFYARIISNDIDYFKISADFALGLHKFYQRLEKENLSGIKFIKGQITGPFTFAASINDDQGLALLHDPVFMQVILKALAMKALWQIKLFSQFGKKIILFIDEPYLGCFGSAYTPLNREDVVKGLSELTASIKSQDVLLGAHCCGNTDWSIFTEIGSLDIISFDAFAFLDRFMLYAQDLKGFLKRGGSICWGIVPTQEFTSVLTADTLIGKIKEAIRALVKKGFDKDLLSENLLLSPSCGLGTLDTDKSTKIFSLLSEVKNKLFDNFT
jgi:methionine synthase II (cobalamin-independent)